MKDITEKIDLILAGKRRVDEKTLNSIIEIMTISYLSEDCINEGIVDSITNLKGKLEGALKKMGVSVHKDNDGLIVMALKASKNIGLMLYYSIKASSGDSSAKTKLVEILKSVKREEVLDFLLKLDGVTMHFLTGPIHFIDNLTGWHIWATIKNHAEKSYDKVVTVIKDLISIAHETPDTKVKHATKDFVNTISNFFGLEQFKMT